MKTLVALCLTALILPVTLFGQMVEWAVSLNGWSSDAGSSICVDSSGNIYTTGKMSSGSIAGTPVTVRGRYDTYLAKFDPVGTLIWAVTAGGNDPGDPNERDGGGNVIYDPFSNALYVSGGYQGQTFGNQAIFGPGIEVSGKGAYLAKFDLDGNCMWLRTTNNSGGSSIAVDDSGQIYLYLWTDDSYGPNTTFAGTPALILPNGPILSKFSSDGTLLWANSLGSNIDGNIMVQNNKLYFAGGSFDPGSTFLGTAIPQSGTENRSGLIAELDTNGTTITWLRAYGSTLGAAIVNLKIQTTGELLLVGVYKDSLFLPTDTLLGSSDTYWPFYSKVSSSGTMDWIQAIPLNAISTNIETLPDGSMYLAIEFSGSFSIPSGTITSTSNRDFAIIRCLPDGTPIGAVHFGEVEIGQISMQATPDYGVVVAGQYSNSLDFGDGHVLGGSYDDLFIAKLGAITGVSTIRGIGPSQLRIYANPNNGLCTVELPNELRFTPNLVLSVFDGGKRWHAAVCG